MSSKKIAVFICMLILTSALLGQSTLTVSGTVKDPSGAVVRGATVALISRNSTISSKTVTDSAGHYHFENLSPDSYLLTASARGLESSEALTVEIWKNSNADADLRLHLSAVAASVSVTASGTPQTADEIAKSVSIVSGETIETLDSPTISESLSYVPGLRIEQLGGPGGVVSIKTRGLRDQDTAVLIDGFRLRDASAPEADATGLLQDLLVTNVERIEVLRGTGSSIYGTNATGGVINIITGEGGGQTRGSVLLEGGSMDSFRGRAAVSGSALNSKLGYSLGIAHYNVVGGLDGNLPARTSSAHGLFDFALSRRTRVFGRLLVTDSFSRFTESPISISTAASGSVSAVPLASSQIKLYEEGVPLSSLNVGNANFIPDTDDPDQNRAARHYSGALIVSSQLNDSLSLNASYQGLSTHRNYDYGSAGGTYVYDGMLHTVSTRMDWHLGKYQSIDAGYEFENENFGNPTIAPTGNSTVDVTQRNQAIFVQDQIQLLQGRLQLAGSYRAQFFSLESPELEPTNSAPYAGMKFNAPPTSNTWDASTSYFFRESGTKLRAHVGTGYRAPSLYERFGTSFYYGYSAYGDPELKPEQTTAVDGGIEQDFWHRKALASATYFYTRLHEVITAGAVNPITDPYGRSYGYYNTKGGIARGVEASFAVTPVKTFNLRAAYTFTNARETAPTVPGVYQTFITPDHQFSLLATEHVTPAFTLVFGTVLSSYYLAPIYNSTTYADQSFRFDGCRKGQVGASYRFPLGESKAVRTFVNVDNSFHQTYYESGYRTPGTKAMSGMQFEF